MQGTPEQQFAQQHKRKLQQSPERLPKISIVNESSTEKTAGSAQRIHTETIRSLPKGNMNEQKVCTHKVHTFLFYLLLQILK